WRAEVFPNDKRVAVVFIDAEMGEVTLTRGRRETDELESDIGGRPGDVVVVVVPEENADLSSIKGGQGSDIGIAAHAVLEHGIYRDGMVADRVEPPAGHFAEHTQDVHDGQVDAVSGKTAEAGEIGLIFEFEGPDEGAFEIDTVSVGQLELAG